MTDEKCKVIEHRELGSGYRFISFEAPKIAEDATPGQFVHVRVPGLEASALRRPFSIFNAEEGRLELLYKTVGRGTAALNGVKLSFCVLFFNIVFHKNLWKIDMLYIMTYFVKMSRASGGRSGVSPRFFFGTILKKKWLFIKINAINFSIFLGEL